MAALGPSFVRYDDGRVTDALAVDERHLNSRGFVHGAVISCLLDIALGDNIVAASAEPITGVTSTLTVHFVGTAAGGDWLEASATAVHVGRRIAHAYGEVTVDGRVVATGSASFAISDRPPNGAS